MSRLPTLGGDNGAWGTVLLDYLQVEHAADGTHGISLPAAASFRYVAGTGITGVTGSDGNNGLSPGKAMSTLQAAYDALPSTGGSVILLPGRHNVGSGFVAASAQKPCVFTSLTGYSPIARTPVIASTTFNAQPVIYGSGATLMKVSSGSGIANGWVWQGLSFDMSTTGNLYGIWAEDLNGGRVRDCFAEATHSEQAYLVKTTSPLFDDCSQWRIEDNYVRNMGLCTMNDGAVDGNCNNNQVLNNCLFGGLTGGEFMVKLAAASRCLVMGNEVATIGGAFCRYLGPSHFNHTMFNGGEGTTSPFVQYDTTGYGNVHYNYGSTGGAATGNEVNVNDLDAANSTATGSFTLGTTRFPGGTTQTGDFTLGAGNWHQNLIPVDKATAVVGTIATQANAAIPIGSNLKFHQVSAGQLTVTPAGGVTFTNAFPVKTRGQGSVIDGHKTAANTWTWYGDLAVELGSIERASSNYTTTTTTQASATTALTMASITFGGGVKCNFELSCLATNSVTGTATEFNLWEDSTDLGCIARFEGGKATTPENGMIFGRIQRTPAAGAKVYTIRGWNNGASTGTMFLGNGTTIPPATFTISRA